MTEDITTDFTFDCSRCAALCCVALEIDCSTQFAIDKPAGRPCPNLTKQGRCTIHKVLSKSGFSGCTRYDCLGAGQKVTQEVFDGQSWQDDPALLRPMIDAFRVMRQIQALRQLLDTARMVPMDAAQQMQRKNLQIRLSRDTAWSIADLDAFERGEVAHLVAEFLSTLKPNLAGFENSGLAGAGAM